MIVNKELVTQMYSSFTKASKTTKTGITIGQFQNWCHTLNYLASLDLGESKIERHDISLYEIPAPFVDMIIPRKVGYALGIEYTDIRSEIYSGYVGNEGKYDMDSARILSSLEFNEISMAIVADMRSGVQLKSVLDASEEKTISEMYHRLQCHYDDEYVRYATEFYVPIFTTVPFVLQRFHNHEASEVFMFWFVNALKQFK